MIIFVPPTAAVNKPPELTNRSAHLWNLYCRDFLAMLSRAIVLALISTLASGPALASESEAGADAATSDQSKWITQAVNVLSDCAGFYDFMSEVAKTEGKPASAEQVHNFANGARMAAGYLLAVEYATKNEKPKAIGEFSLYVDGRADVERARMAALMEQLDIESVTRARERCVAALPMQEDIVQKIRNDSVGR